MEYRVPVAEPDIGEDELKKVIEAVKSGWVSSKGPFIEEFEDKFARYIGLKHGVATSSGTAALHLALAALNIKRGDEVIIPTLTFASVANAVIYTGAKPVFVDSHPDYWCINPNKLEEKITENTKAIIPVHLYGHPCDMDPIMKIAKIYDLYVIEDCAEAHGAEYKGQKVGTFGDIACFSFYGNKIITTGEGGMCLTNNDELAQKIKMLRDHGMSLEKRYWHEVIGFNYRMTNLQAALGVAQLERIDKFIERKREIAKFYNTLLKDVNGVILHPEMSWAKNVYWLYSILIDKEKFNLSRDQLMIKLAESGIETRRFFYPIHTMPPYKKYVSHDTFIVANRLSSLGISLPSSVKLTLEKIEKIVQLIISAQRGNYPKHTDFY
jgi:perosamine synthetase